MVLSNWASMKGTRMDGAATTISGKEFGKGGMEVIGNERGDNIFFTVGNDKKVVGTCFSEVVLPSRTWKDAWLRTIGTWGLSFSVSVHGLVLYVLCFGMLVQDHSHGGDRGRGIR